MSVRDGKRRQRAKEERRKTNPGLTGGEMTDDVVKDIIKGRTGEQERIQQKVFAKWINSRFVKVGSPRRIEDLFQDLRTGVHLAALVELITGVKVPVEKGRTRLHYVCNITKSLEILDQNDIKLVNISADDIADGNTKLTLSLTWAIIQQFYVKHFGGAVTELRVSNLEKTLLCWTQIATKSYPHVDVKNLSTSWTDGLAFNALIHKYRDDLFDYSALLNNTAEVNLAHAFSIAECHLNVISLLEPQDLLHNTPDQKSIATYLLCLLEALPHETMEVKAIAAVSELDGNIAGGDAKSDHSAVAAYRTSVENVLAWMLSLEEKLDRCDISDDLVQAKQLWAEHETSVSELSVQQNTVQLVLDHGARLLQNQTLHPTHISEVENHLTVITEKWENLRIKSTERSKLLQKIITILQEERLKTVDNWLSDTEKRVSLLKTNATSIEGMDFQLRELSKLQDDLEKQLLVMNELLHVIIVGEDVDQSGMESQLHVFRERWEVICHFTEAQWTLVRRIRTSYDDFLKLCHDCGDWVTSRIDLLQSLPTVANDRLDWVQRNLDLLHEMHDQMLDYQERIQAIQEKSDELVAYFTPQTSVGMQVCRREEKVCSEWNQLVDLLEFWTSDKNMHFEKSDILRNSKIRHSKRFSETVDSSIVTTVVEENEPKTKKARQEEMDEGLLENCEALLEWLREKERLLADGDNEESRNSSSSDQSLTSLIVEEMTGKEAEYNSLRLLAEDIIMEKRSANAPFDMVERKLNELAALWNNLSWLIGTKSSPLAHDQDKDSFNHNLEVLENVLISCQKSVERFGGEKEPTLQQIEQDLTDCKDRIHLMEINDTRVMETSALARKLAIENLQNGETDAPWDNFLTRWQATRQRLNELDVSFTNLKESQPLKKFLADVKELQAWANQVHQMLMDEPSIHATYLDKMEDSQRNYQEIQQSILQRQEMLELINSPPKQLIDKLSGSTFQMDLIDLNAKWKDIRQYLDHNINQLTKWIEELRAFQIDVDGLKQWMVDVDSFLNIDIAAVEDAKTFSTIQEQFQGLEDDIKVLAPTVEKLLEAGKQFLRTDQKEFVACVQESLAEMENQWNSICTRATRQLHVITTLSARHKREATEVEREIHELETLCRRLEGVSEIPTLEALEGAVHVVEHIKQTLDQKREAVLKLTEHPGNSESINDSQVDQLHQLDMLFHDCSAAAKSKHQFLIQFTSKWSSFSTLLTEDHSWMDKLERLIHACETCEDQGDHRRLLTELNDFMKTQNSDNYVTVADLAEEFDNQKILAPLVRSELEKLRQRLSKLSKRAQEQQNLPRDAESRSSVFSDSGSETGGHSAFIDSLEKVTKLLNDLRSKLPAMELKTFDSVVIKGQLDECVLLYKTLSEIKGEVELLIKQGREIVEVDRLPENDGLSRRLDSMKSQYNQLGAQVTATKAELDNALKLVKKAEKELDLLRVAMDDIDMAIAELEKLAGSEEFNHAVEDVKFMVAQQEEPIAALQSVRRQLREIAMKPNIPGFDPKYTKEIQRWNGIQGHVKTVKPRQEVILQKADIVSREVLSSGVVCSEPLQRKEAHVVDGVVISDKSSAFRQNSLDKSSPPPHGQEIIHLKEYLRMLRQRIDSVRENIFLARGKGDANDVKKLESETTSLEQHLKDVQSVEIVILKYDSVCSRIEESTRMVLKVPPSATEVKERFAELEALKHDVMVSEMLYKDALGSVGDAVTKSHCLEIDSGKLDPLENHVRNRWNNLQHKLDAASTNLNTIRTYHQLLKDDFLQWLENAESLVDKLAVEEKTTELTNEHMLLVEERDRRIPTYEMITKCGHDLLATVYKSSDGEPLKSQLGDVVRRWISLNGKLNQISKAKPAEEKFDVEAYMNKLEDHIRWVVRKKDELSTLQPTCERAVLQKLHDYHQLFRAQLEANRAETESILDKGKLLEERLQSPNYKSPRNLSMDDLNTKIRTLSDSWLSLFEQSNALNLETEFLTSELDKLLSLCDSARTKSEDLQAECHKWEATDDVNVDDLLKRTEETNKFKTKVDAHGVKLEEVNSVAGKIQRLQAGLSEDIVRSVSSLNEQHELLRKKVDGRLAQLNAASVDVGSSDNQHLLATSVDQPWERRVAPNKVPYYINHAEQTTQWDHPRMTDLMSSLLEVNKIRFSAYRTATKLRIMQKKLYLDLLQLSTAIEIFDKCGLRGSNDTTLDCPQAVACLMVIYERLNELYPNRINFALGIDVCLNWLLNCHDPDRTGRIRVSAFKLSLIVLCQGELSLKYRYLFRLIADANSHADQEHVAQLLDICVQIPRYLGEVAAFGGSNVEPSVKSCFEFSTNGIDIQNKQFLAWLAREPQAMVWLSVLHRLIAAEQARHPAKCNICRQFPIVGLRYRCLKCFNFDLCQNCFFQGNKSKHHKISHPMQEYCFPATSSEDMRDFKRVLKNKLRPREQAANRSKLGYLPVQPGAGRGTDHMESATLTSLNTKGSVSSSEAADFTQCRVIEFEGSRGASSPEVDDEHNVIARYCSTLNGTPDSAQTTVQVLQTVEREEKLEMEKYLQQLQTDHDRLINELEGVRQLHDDMPNDDVVAEASMLREDKDRLEARMKILEDHNRQLDAQLQRIKNLLEETPDRGTSPAPTNRSNSASARYNESLEDSPIAHRLPSRSPSSINSSPAMSKISVRQDKYSVGQLFHAADSLNVAVGSLVMVMNEEEKKLENNNVNGNS